MDKYSFEGALSMLLKHSLKVLEEEDIPGAATAIRNYQARMDATIQDRADIHRAYFTAVYTSHKEAILAGTSPDDFDAWLRDGGINVVFGSENPEASHKGFIPLSEVYNAANRAVFRARSRQDQLIIYPKIFLLHLYRIFRALAEDGSEEYRALDEIMVGLEADLKSGNAGEQTIKACSLTFPESVANMDPSESLKAMMNDPMMDNVFSLVTNTFAQSGMIPKEELDKISINDIRNQFTNLLGTDALKNAFGYMSKSMSSAKTPEDAILVGMSMMKDEALMNEWARAMDPKVVEEPPTSKEDVE